MGWTGQPTLRYTPLPDPIREKLMRFASRLIAAFAFLVITGVSATPAAAHAILVLSSPAANGTVAGPAITFELHFNSRIDASRSLLTLIRPDKTKTPLTLATDSPQDELKASAELTPGDYVARWQVLAVDGHITRGDVPFTVTDH